VGKRQDAASGNVALRHAGEKGWREIFETAVTIPGLRDPGICEGDDASAPGSKSQL
jgi:hypothetical protein